MKRQTARVRTTYNRIDSAANNRTVAIRIKREQIYNKTPVRPLSWTYIQRNETYKRELTRICII